MLTRALALQARAARAAACSLPSQKQLAALPRRALLPTAHPQRRSLMSATSAEMVAAGAPFTNSVYLRPSSSGGLSLASSIPDYAPFTLPQLSPELPLSELMASLSASCGGAPVVLIVNNTPLSASAVAAGTLGSLMGASLDLQVAGVRYCVNEGARLAATGSGAVKKRSAAVNSFFVVAGAVATLVGGLAFWSAVIPEENQRRYR